MKEIPTVVQKLLHDQKSTAGCARRMNRYKNIVTPIIPGWLSNWFSCPDLNWLGLIVATICIIFRYYFFSQYDITTQLIFVPYYLPYLYEGSFNLSDIDGRVEATAQVHHYVCTQHLSRSRRTSACIISTGLTNANPIEWVTDSTLISNWMEWYSPISWQWMSSIGHLARGSTQFLCEQVINSHGADYRYEGYYLSTSPHWQMTVTTDLLLCILKNVQHLRR